MKKFLTLFLFVIILFSSGCKRDNKIHISYSTWGSQSEISTIKSLVSDFEKENPSIKIDLIHIPDNYFQKLHLLIASNLAPDVIFINNLNTPVYINSRKIQSLNNYIDNSTAFEKDDFIGNAFLPVTKNNSIYVMPRDISNIVIYYNKSLFDKYSIQYPSDNWTFDDFLKTALLIKDKSHGQVFGMGFEKKSLFWLPFLLSNDGGILSDTGNVIIDNENSINSLQFYSDLRNKYHVSPSSSQQAALTTSQLFMQGKVAMHACGRWCSLTYRKNADFDWDIVAFPKGSRGSVVGLDVSGWAISSSSKHKDVAWKFIEFMVSEKSMTKFSKDGLIVPSRKSVAYSPVFLDGYPANAVAFLKAVDTSVPTPICTKYVELNDLIDENFESLFDGKKSAFEIIDKKFVKTMSDLANDK